MSETVRSSLRNAAKGTTFVFAGMIVSQILWFATRLLLVRNLSREDLGIYSLILGTVSLLSLLASAGLWQGSTRYISIFSGQGRKSDSDAVHRASLVIGMAAGTGTCVLMVLLSGIVSRYLFYKPELALPLMSISLFIPTYVLAMTFGSVLRGYGNIRPSVYFIDVGQPFFFLLFLILIFVFRLSFLSIIYAYVLSTFFSCALIARYAYRQTGTVLPPASGARSYSRELLAFSIPILSIDVMFLLFRWADTLMLGRYGTAEEVGVYSVGVSLAVLLNLPLVALGFVYMPIAGELYAKKRMPELARTYQVLTKWIFAATLPLFFILFFFPDMTITFLFGGRFQEAVLPLRILALGYLVTTFLGTNSILLLVFGLSKAVLKISAMGIILDILLNYILIKHLGLGMQGASIATAVSLMTVSLGYSLVLYRYDGIHPVSRAYLKPALASAVIGVIIYAAASILPHYFWLLPLYFLLYTGGYAGSLLLTRSLDEEDVFLFVEVLRRAGFSEGSTSRVLKKIYRRDMGKLDFKEKE